MRVWFLFRLALDFLAVGLLIVAFLYDWMGNVAHEIAGTVMFALLIGHNVLNRRWWGGVHHRQNDASGQTSRAVNVCLLLAMVVLVATSIVISQAVFSILPLKSTFIFRQVHTLVAYAVLMIAGVHLGLHWSMIMGIVLARLGVVADSKLRAIGLRLVAGTFGVFGIRSIFALDIASKLSMQVPIGFLTFEMPAPTMLLNHVFLVGGFACVGHYSRKLMVAGRRVQAG